MPADKDAAKRRRQARNRQERENRQARTEGAKRSASRPSRTAEETPARGRGKGATTSLAKDDAPAPAPGGLLGKLFPPRPDAASSGRAGAGERPGRRPPPPPSVVVEVDEGASGLPGILQRSLAQPGGKAVLLAVVVGLVCFVTLLVAPVWPTPVLTAVGEQATTISAEVGDWGTEQEAIDAYDEGDPVFVQGAMTDAVVVPIGVAFAFLPVAISAIAFSSLTKPSRSRTLLFCAMGGVLYFFVSGPLGTYFLPGAAALGWGAWQSRKVDQRALAAAD